MRNNKIKKKLVHTAAAYPMFYHHHLCARSRRRGAADLAADHVMPICNNIIAGARIVKWVGYLPECRFRLHLRRIRTRSHVTIPVCQIWPHFKFRGPTKRGHFKPNQAIFMTGTPRARPRTTYIRKPTTSIRPICSNLSSSFSYLSLPSPLFCCYFALFCSLLRCPTTKPHPTLHHGARTGKRVHHGGGLQAQ